MEETKEWTIMFYLASDNPLAPGVVSQLKAIKQAGFHPEANVIAQFDPYTVGTPTHIFDVNLVEKLKNHGAPNIGFAGNDPFVRNLLADKLWRDQRSRGGTSPLREELRDRLKRDHSVDYNPPVPPNGRGSNGSYGPGHQKELPPKQSLEAFLKFCRDRYPARHYMLFILGHGVVVGNDIFLFDEHADSHSLSLVELGDVLTAFKEEVQHQGSEFELLGFHSCSVSALEVAYELQGTANYMMASQGPAFVGSWPYRQMLIRVFNDLVRYGENIYVKEMIIKLFYYCLFNSVDFLLAGYSYDLCLCNLNKISEIEVPLKALSETLIAALPSPLIKNFILLAHWRSQSFWQESYTDLYDFCFCLNKLCREHEELNSSSGSMQKTLQDIQTACRNMMTQLMKEDPKEARRNNDAQALERIVVRAEFAGPEYQYSHGLSVFFPWSKPSEDSQILSEYERYKFQRTSWLKFLTEYFTQTQRDPRKDEVDDLQPEPTLNTDEQLKKDLLEDIASLVYNEEGQLSNQYALGPGPVKSDPEDRTGDGSTTLSIKNYPHDTRSRAERRKQVEKPEQAVPLSTAFLTQI